MGDSAHRLERELERIFSSLGHGMYVVDADRRILRWNRAAEYILGWPETDALGKDCREFIGHLNDDGKQLCEDECPLTATMEKAHTVFAGTVWGHSRTGDLVPVNVSCAPLFDDEGNMIGAVEVFSDMTREKEVDRLKSEMCSVVAHELRTPLTSMRGYLEMVVEGETGEVSEEQGRFLKIVQSNVDRLQELVDDLLDLDRLESGRVTLHWEEVDLVELARESVDSLRPMVELKPVEIVVELEEVSTIMGDRKLLGQVMYNLVSNAVKYTEKGEVRLTSSEENGSVVLEVKDTGVGIPEDELDKILERFYRASTAPKAAVRGSGLGLSITKDIVEKHGGELRIKSRAGQGSSFSVVMPAAKEADMLEYGGDGTDE